MSEWTPELKSCPFCLGKKGKPQIEELHNGDGETHGGWRISCYGCSLMLYAKFWSAKKAYPIKGVKSYKDGHIIREHPESLVERWNNQYAMQGIPDPQAFVKAADSLYQFSYRVDNDACQSTSKAWFMAIKAYKQARGKDAER